MTDGPPFRTVSVVGLGAMGGSVAKVVMRRSPGVPVFGVDPDRESAGRAARDGVRVTAQLEDCDVDGGVVVFAAPLDVTVRLVSDTGAVWRRAALATDVASLKVAVLEAAQRAGQAVEGVDAAQSYPGPVVLRGGVFVGAHPMCGSERTGYAAARTDLFEGARVWLCPAAGAESAAWDFWTMLGARPLAISAERHDRLMACASHLPQLLANALAATLQDARVTPNLLGPGGRGMTRLAGSSPAMWLPLLEAAATEDAAALLDVERQIAAIRRLLESGDAAGLEELMERGRRWVSARA